MLCVLVATSALSLTCIACQPSFPHQLQKAAALMPSLLLHKPSPPLRSSLGGSVSRLFPHLQTLMDLSMGNRDCMQAITTSSIAYFLLHHNTHKRSFWFHLLVPSRFLSHCCIPAFWLAVASLVHLASTSISFEVCQSTCYYNGTPVQEHIQAHNPGIQY